MVHLPVCSILQPVAYKGEVGQRKQALIDKQLPSLWLGWMNFSISNRYHLVTVIISDSPTNDFFMEQQLKTRISIS